MVKEMKITPHNVFPLCVKERQRVCVCISESWRERERESEKEKKKLEKAKVLEATKGIIHLDTANAMLHGADHKRIKIGLETCRSWAFSMWCLTKRPD